MLDQLTYSDVPAGLAVDIGAAVASSNSLLYRRDSVKREGKEIGYIQHAADQMGRVFSLTFCGPMAVHGVQVPWILVMEDWFKDFDVEDIDMPIREMPC